MSPLRYRHGAIIVRGGKGALMSGIMPLRSLDGPAIAELKRKHKLKLDQKRDPEPTINFKPFEETTGGGKLANTPLSMHSEMMAIQSALVAAGSLASSAVSSQKPCCKYYPHCKSALMMC